ncbi:Asp-tRNA(Asn)/Glu-tRNA(Gln) amidotransferase GatCAB subunit B [Candidatus Woesebacteria bacterium]|nr:Asp-tRNA(Asn)/Glu-tRNA(Gln) amidotransferase GatCAB subunit B [Candidatus Woesebacteria bacterium]
MKYQPVIGLEVHVELKTDSKMFCACSADHFAKKPNTQVCPVCLGLPGALPVPNEKAIEWTQKLGAALGCKLAIDSQFDRKHYFYPDLPKGYQISQYQHPLAEGGKFQSVNITRVHLEEDTGKLMHQKVGDKNVSLIDFNRSGVPLVEIVTDPDFSSASGAKSFARDLQQTVRHLGVSDADMEKGSMRLEANISVGDKSQATSDKLPNYKVELKNINSFRFMEAAINYEIERQEKVLENGESLIQETRGYDEKTKITKPQRTKEEAQDYRYFPEPDIPPLSFSNTQLEKVKSGVSELPQGKRESLVAEHKIPEMYAAVLTRTEELSDYFSEAVKIGDKHGLVAKKIADFLVNKKTDIKKVSPEGLVKMIKGDGEKSSLSDKHLEKAVEDVVGKNKGAVADYKAGKEVALKFLVGQVMAKTKGQANPRKVQDLLSKKLNE